MTPALVAIGLFLAALVGVAFWQRNATLDRLEPLPGEAVVLEEDGVTVEQRGAPRTARFPGCRVRLTTHRLVVAQKVLFRKDQYVLRHVIHLDGGGADSLRGGYVQATVPRDRVEVTGGRVVLPLGDAFLVAGQRAEFAVARPEAWAAALAGPPNR